MLDQIGRLEFKICFIVVYLRYDLKFNFYQDFKYNSLNIIEIEQY